MLRKFALAVMLLSTMSACASTQTVQDVNPSFASHQFSNHELEITWKTQNTDQGVKIDGTVRNVRQNLPYTSLELTTKLLDDGGKVLGTGAKIFDGRFVGKEPFSIEVPLDRKESLKRINFSYSYGTGEDFFRNNFDSVP